MTSIDFPHRLNENVPQYRSKDERKVGMSFLRRITASLHRGLLGEHPHNTFLSFNWHNVRHIRNFLEDQSRSLERRPYIIADIGGGRSPYHCYFNDLAEEFICFWVRPKWNSL